MLAARALWMMHHIHPWSLRATEEERELALVGGMLLNELVHDSRGLVETPMRALFLAGGPVVQVGGPDGE